VRRLVWSLRGGREGGEVLEERKATKAVSQSRVPILLATHRPAAYLAGVGIRDLFLLLLDGQLDFLPLHA